MCLKKEQTQLTIVLMSNEAISRQFTDAILFVICDSSMILMHASHGWIPKGGNGLAGSISTATLVFFTGMKVALVAQYWNVDNHLYLSSLAHETVVRKHSLYI